MCWDAHVIGYRWIRQRSQDLCAERWTDHPTDRADYGLPRVEMYREQWRNRYPDLRDYEAYASRDDCRVIVEETFALADTGKPPPPVQLAVPWGGLNWRASLKHELLYSDKLSPNDVWDSSCDPRLPHVDPADPKLLRFVASHWNGLRGKTTSMKPGRYLARFYPEMGAEEIQRLAVLWNDANVEPTVLFARTGEDIERVYTTGPNSCMSYSAANFGGVHPVRAYAAGDLAVAYLEVGEKIQARAIVWPDRKIYGRIYGCAARLAAALRREGYSEGSLAGARILKLEKGPGAYSVPYLDRPASAVDDEGDLFRLSENGEHSAQSTEGILYIHELNCDECGDRCGETQTVNGHSDWCASCVENQATNCDGCNEWVSGVTETQDRHNVCVSCLRNDYTRCEGCREYYLVAEQCDSCEPAEPCEYHEDEAAEDCPACAREAKAEAEAELAGGLRGEFVAVGQEAGQFSGVLPGHVPLGSYLAATLDDNGQWSIIHIPTGLTALAGSNYSGEQSLARTLRMLEAMRPWAREWNFSEVSGPAWDAVRPVLQEWVINAKEGV